MQRIMCRAKLHRLTVTETNVNYEGSITLDAALLKAADILPHEKVQVVNISNGHRFETYAIEGISGEVCLNGAAARLATPGDLIIVICYTLIDEKEAKTLVPKIVHVDSHNKIK
ncbi:MAG: aspartate 1-decarboxylase [Candidatus Margulisbacteria bacterium]|nr:aspartate 1-decarboxylase [Candidatus Margulisiibacteriota bacterium]MBU1021483.1 aspartate 1-decarboxylase [Candidatus Margulisiibacteriota bacterium]MBU1728568.1 aspartate 1-decarboxylase [Candidatus Margulisiibacteriota bacterium]MBU1955853.1 aspartate 1-decarboxylase [Candidatus Margulisiibacteriota bacterium]